MATTYFSTNTDIGLVNALNQSVNIYLPQTISGKNIYIKDAAGTSQKSTITIFTQGSDSFEDGSVKQVLNQPYGSYILSYSTNKWFTTGGTFYNTMNVSTIVSGFISTNSISSTSLSVSTMKFQDQILSSVGTLNSISSLLYYNSNLIGGGFREALPQQINSFNFKVIQNSNLALWIDTSKPSSFTFTATSNLTVCSNQSPWLLSSDTANSGGPYWSTIGPTKINAMYFLPAGANGSIMYTTNYFYTVAETYFAIVYLNGLTIGNNSALVVKNDIGNGRYFYVNVLNANNAVLQTNVYTATSLLAGNLSTNTLNLIGFVRDSVNVTHYVNGTASVSSNVGSMSGGIQSIIGDVNTIQYPYNGFMSEILVYSNSVDTLFRQKTEGYLAWKWNIQTSLPITHPYYSAPPS